jgi:hypothetical protein
VQLAHQSHGALKFHFDRWRARDKDANAPAEAARTAADGTHVNASGGADAREAKPDAAAAELGTDNLVYREPSDATWREAWAVTEELLKTMSGEAAARGARFVVVTLSNGIQVYPDASAREAFLRRVGARDIFYPDFRIKALGEREGFAVFNLAPPLQRYADENRAFLHGFGDGLGNGHWNQLGHRVAGELLAQHLCDGRQPK